MIKSMFSFTVQITLALSLLIALILILSEIIKQKYSAKFQCSLWLILAIRLAVPLNLNIKNIIFNEIVPNKIIAVPALQILTTIWIVGGCCYFLYHIVQYSILKNNLKRWGDEISHRKILHLYNSIKYGMNIYDNIKACVSQSVSTPMLIGVLHPKIILPNCKFTEEQLSMVLRHELMHFKRRDNYYKALLLLVGTVHWFNPLVHIMIHKSCKAIEISCDSQVVEGQDQAFLRAYAQTIIDVARLSAANIAGGNNHTVLNTYFESSKDILKQRFLNLFFNNRCDNRCNGKGVLAIIALALAMI